MNLDKLEADLISLPNRIYNQEIVVIAKKEVVEKAKIELKITQAGILLGSNRPNATEKKAESERDSRAEQAQLLTAEIEYEGESAKLTALNNSFVAKRKVASLENELIKSKIQGN